MTDHSVYIIFLHVQSLSPTVALWICEDHQPSRDRKHRREEEIRHVTGLQRMKDMERN